MPRSMLVQFEGLVEINVPPLVAATLKAIKLSFDTFNWNQPNIMFGYCRTSPRSLMRSLENRTAIYLDNNIIISLQFRGLIKNLPLVHFDLKMIKKSSWKLNAFSWLSPPFYFYVYRKCDGHFQFRSHRSEAKRQNSRLIFPWFDQPGVVAHACNPATWRLGSLNGLRVGFLGAVVLCRSGVRAKFGVNMGNTEESEFSRLVKEERTGPGWKHSRQKLPRQTVVG